MTASLGTAAQARGGIGMMEFRAKTPRKPAALTVAGKKRKSGGRRRPQRNNSSKANNTNTEIQSKVAVGNNDSQHTSATTIPLSKEGVKKAQQMKDGQIELTNQKVQALIDGKAGDGEARIKLAEIDRQQFKGVFDAFNLSADKDGRSGFAGEMFDEWQGQRGRGTIAEKYTDNEGNERIRFVIPGEPTLTKDPESGAMIQMPGKSTPADFHGTPADFSMADLQKRLDGMGKKAKVQKTETGKDGYMYNVLDDNTAVPVMMQGKNGIPAKFAPADNTSVKKDPMDAAQEYFTKRQKDLMPDRTNDERTAAATKQAAKDTVKYMKSFYNMSDSEAEKMRKNLSGKSNTANIQQQMMQIKQDYKFNKLSKEEAKKKLQALKG